VPSPGKRPHLVDDGGQSFLRRVGVYVAPLFASALASLDAIADLRVMPTSAETSLSGAAAGRMGSA
jgi:hypothetical protein